MTSLAKLLLLALAPLVCAGCGEQPGMTSPTYTATQEPDVPETKAPSPSSSATDGADIAPTTALYEGAWVVEEGVWWIHHPDQAPEFENAFDGQRNGLLGAGERGHLVFSGPALYGKHRVRVELHPDKPKVPAWCEDVVEVSLHSRGQLQMWSFETWAEPWEIPAGDYRVRYCVTGLDTVAEETAEDEFDGDDYRLYSGRHLLQLWPAKPAADEVLRVGSRWADAEHRRVH